MTYLLDLGAQGHIFLLSLGFGFLMGILYDVLRMFRMLFQNSKTAFLIFDLLYMLLAAICTFLFLLSETDGSVRAYVLFSELLGFLIYFVTLGTVLSAFFDRIVSFLENLFHKLFLRFQKFSFWILKPFHRKMTAKAKKAEKKAHFSIKKSKIHLKSLYDLLYNQHIRKSANRNVPKGRESEVDQNGKNKKRKKTSSKKS